jgi:3-vinyl bacteriochlorophyllide hydratase
MKSRAQHRQQQKLLYTEAQRRRRDESRWTLVQGVLAPVQFVVFAVSAVLVCRFLLTGEGHDLAALSVLVKTLILLLIMVTGAFWEKAVFGQYLFVPAFFWEDVVSNVVIVAHLAYVLMFAWSLGTQVEQMLVALVAYTLYLINAAQYLIKFRRARLGAASAGADTAAIAPAAAGGAVHS